MVGIRNHAVDSTERILIAGRADFDRCDNKVKSARYTLLTFFPKVCKTGLCATSNLMISVAHVSVTLICFKGYSRAISPLRQFVLLRSWFYYVFGYLYTFV
jgi:hypothetical protein